MNLEKIFTKEPQKPNTIDVLLSNNIKEKFEDLLCLFNEGMKKLYGKDGKVNLENITVDNMLTMQLYYNSFGFYLHFRKFDSTQMNEVNEELLTLYKDVESNNLKDYKLQLICNQILYIIYFEKV